jgi:hypothetical protein
VGVHVVIIPHQAPFIDTECEVRNPAPQSLESSADLVPELLHEGVLSDIGLLGANRLQEAVDELDDLGRNLVLVFLSLHLFRYWCSRILVHCSPPLVCVTL